MSKKTRKSTLGNAPDVRPAKPLDGLINAPEVGEATKATRKATRGKQRFTVGLDADTIERVRNAAFWTPGETLSSISSRALEAEIERMEAARGEPFPERTGDIPTGRPLKQ